MLRRISMLLMISSVMFCYAAQEPAVKCCKQKEIPTLQKMAQNVVMRSVLALFQSSDAQALFKVDPLQVLCKAQQYLHLSPEVQQMLIVEQKESKVPWTEQRYFYPCVEAIIIAKLLKKYKAVITAGCIKFKKEIAGAVNTIAHVLRFNRQGNLLACGGLRSASQGHVSIRNIETDRLLLSLQCEDEVTALAFNATSDQLAIGHKWGSIVILSLEGKQVHHITEYQDAVNALDYSPDSRFFASACQDGTISIFDVSNGQCIRRLLHRGLFDMPVPISYVQLLDDGTVYSAGHGWGYVWNAQGVLQQQYPCQASCMIQNTSRAYFMWKDKKLEIRDDYNRLLVSRLPCYRCCVKARSKAFKSDGSLLAVGLSNGSIYLYDCLSYPQAIDALSLMQALYVRYKLDDKDEGRSWGGISPFAKYCLMQESDAYKEVGASLPDAFKKMVA